MHREKSHKMDCACSECNCSNLHVRIVHDAYLSPYPIDTPHCFSEPSQVEIENLIESIRVMMPFACNRVKCSTPKWEECKETIKNTHRAIMTKASFLRACGCFPSSWTPVNESELFLNHAHLSVVVVAPMFDVLGFPIGAPVCSLCNDIEINHAYEISENDEAVYDELVALVIDTYTNSNLVHYLGVEVKSEKSMPLDVNASVEQLDKLFDEWIFEDFSSLVQNSCMISMVEQFSDMVDLHLLECQPSYKSCALNVLPYLVFVDDMVDEEGLEIASVMANFSCRYFTSHPSMRFLTLEEISFFWYRDGYSEMERLEG